VNGVTHLGARSDRIGHCGRHAQIQRERARRGSEVPLIVPVSRKHGVNLQRSKGIDLLGAVFVMDVGVILQL
jgi:hypothetical protein